MKRSTAAPRPRQQCARAVYDWLVYHLAVDLDGGAVTGEGDELFCPGDLRRGRRKTRVHRPDLRGVYAQLGAKTQLTRAAS